MSAPHARLDVLVVGAGPAGVAASIRAAELGARTTLLTDGAFGGMAANDGPVPVRTLAHAARLVRDVRQLADYGVEVGEPKLDYRRLLERARIVTGAVRTHSALRPQADAAGVVVREHVGQMRFRDPHTLVSPAGETFHGDRIILCCGGVSRRLQIPGADLACTHGDALSLTSVPPSMIVIGAGATGLQVASIFNAFGTRVQVFETGRRILPTEDADVSAEVAACMSSNGIDVRDGVSVERLEKVTHGVRAVFTENGVSATAEAALVVAAIGWTAASGDLNLAAAGVQTDARGFIRTDAGQRTTAAHTWAAGDVAGGLMLAPQALQAGFAAATNAVTGGGAAARHDINPIGSFTDPEYAKVGLTEAEARRAHDVEVAIASFAETTRGVIDGRTVGFCKLVADRVSHRILGCHLVGDRAVDVAQVAAVAMAGGLTVDDLARLPFSFPTYAGVLARAASQAAYRINGGRLRAAHPAAA